MKFKIENLKSYQVMPNEFLRDKKLSLKAKGLLATFYSLPNEWDYNIAGICKITNTGIRAIRSAIMELELFGYLTRYQTRKEDGTFEYDYIVHIKKQKIKFENVTCLRRMKTAQK